MAEKENLIKELTKGLTKTEIEKLNTTLERLEYDYGREFKNLSGGFCQTTVFDYDEDYIDIYVESGVQNDTENRVYTEQLKIDRNTMEIVN